MCSQISTNVDDTYTTETNQTVPTTVAETTIETTTVVESTTETTTKQTVTTTQPNIQPNGNNYSVPKNCGKFKSYTNYKLISKNSPQWTKIQANSNAYTDNNGLRKVDNYYCVAMGSYYSKTLGDLFRITTENGSFNVIICDFKSNKHTDSTNRYTTRNHCMVEFYVDSNKLNSKAKNMGSVECLDSNFKGNIIKVEKIGNYFN